eukprot:4390574-Ditylum_brightwellii.AAC.1
MLDGYGTIGVNFQQFKGGVISSYCCYPEVGGSGISHTQTPICNIGCIDNHIAFKADLSGSSQKGDVTRVLATAQVMSTKIWGNDKTDALADDIESGILD